MKALLSLLLFAFLSAAPQRVPDSLFIDDAGQVTRISTWYVRNIRGLDSASAISGLEILEKTARERADKVAEAGALFYKGQYLAINSNKHEQGIAFMKKSIAMAMENDETIQWATYTHHMGYYYFFKTQDYSTALLHMLRANEKFAEVGYQKLYDNGYSLYQLAFVYYHLGNYEEALRHCITGWNTTFTNNTFYHRDPVLIRIYLANTIGQCYYKLSRRDSALQYYQITHDLALRSKDEVWTGIAAGNIGAVLVDKKDYKAARNYYQQYYASSITTRNWIGQAEALTELAALDVFDLKPTDALHKLKFAEHLFDSANRKSALEVENYSRLQALYKNYASAYVLQDNFVSAYHFQSLADTVRDSLEHRNTLAGSSTITQQVVAEQRLSEIKLLENERQNAEMKKWFMVSFIFLLLIIALLFYNRLTVKNRRDREMMQKTQDLLVLQNESTQTELRHAEESLNNYTENLKQKTELLVRLQSELQSIRNSDGTVTNDQMESLTTLAKSSILTPDDWKEFRILFEKVHKGFFSRLKEKYPNLTPAETRLLALTKLELTTAEMAGMLGVNADTIKKTRQRLRKDLQMTAGSSIEELAALV